MLIDWAQQANDLYDKADEIGKVIKSKQEAEGIAADNPSFGQRLGKTVTGSAKQYGGTQTNAFATMSELLQGQRNPVNDEVVQECQNRLNTYSLMYKQAEAKGDQQKMVKAQNYIIYYRDKLLSHAREIRSQEAATEATYELADTLTTKGAEEMEAAKQGLGPFGQMLVDAFGSTVQVGLDLIGSRALGIGMLPFAVRAFGGEAQHVRLENPDSELWQQVAAGAAAAAIEVFTEKISNVGLYKTAYGKGTIDGAIEKGISKAVDRFAHSDTAKKIMGSGLTFTAGMLGEGLEEVLSDILNIPVPLIYEGDIETVSEFFDNAVYDGLVGAFAGVFGGLISPQTYNYEINNTGASAGENSRGDESMAVAQPTQAPSGLLARPQETSAPAQTSVYTTEPAIAQEAQEIPAARMAAAPAAQQTAPAMDGREIVADYAESLGKSGAKVITGAYQGGQDPTAYIQAFTAYYNSGTASPDKAFSGKDIAAPLTREQAQWAYTAGQNDARAAQRSAQTDATVEAAPEQNMSNVIANNEVETGVLQNDTGKEEVYLREGGQRPYGQNTGGQVRQLESGTGQAEAGTAYVRTGAADSQAAESLIAGQQRVSAAELGLPNGSTEKTLHIVTGGNTEATASAVNAVSEHNSKYGTNYQVTFVVGGDITTVDGDVKQGYVIIDSAGRGGQIVLCADDPNFTGEQLGIHELTHDLIERKIINIDDVKRDMEGKFSPEAAETISSKYAALYDGTGMSAEEAFIEIICDTRANMNVFQTVGLESEAEAYGQVQEGVRSSIDEQIKARGPPTGTAEVAGNITRTSPRAKMPEDSEEEITKKQKYDFSKSFAEQIDDYKKGNFPKRDTLILGGTPDILQKIGFNALPMTISQSHVDYAINGTKDSDHYLGETLLKQLPKVLEEPVAVYISESNPQRVVVLLEMQQNGKNIIVPVEVDGYGEQNNLRIDSNSVTSVYGKNNAVSGQLFRAMTNNSKKHISLFYLNNKKATSLLQRAGLQLPGRLVQANGFIHSIREPGSIVNVKFKEQAETQQFKRWFGKSVVVNEDGTPKVVYHGSPNLFSVFSYDFIGTQGTAEGKGFYFTDNRNVAEGYSTKRGQNGKLYECYLSIKQPLKPGEFKISKKQYREIIDRYNKWEAGQEDGMMYLLSNYGDYEYSGYLNTLSEAVNLEYNGSSDDIEVLSGFINAGAHPEQLYRFVKEVSGFDGIITEWHSQETPTNIYIPFLPEQIKSATDNIGTFSADNPDIFFSTRPTVTASEELAEENAALREKIESLQAQFKTTAPESRTLRKADVDKYTRKILRDYESTADIDDISQRIKALGELIIRNGDGKNDLTWSEVKSRAADIARDILSNSETLANDYDLETYHDIKSYFRTVKLKYEDKGDIADFNDFRKSHFGHFTISKDGLPVDVAYRELTDIFGEGYFPSEIINSADQLLHIADLFDGMKPIYENPYSFHMAEAAEFVSNEIIDELLGENIRQSPHTFADKKAAELTAQKIKAKNQLDALREQKNQRIKEVKKQGRERTAAAIARERARRDERVQRLKDHYAQVRKDAATRRADSKARTRLLHIAKRLQNKKLPAVNRALLDQYIGDLDTISKGITGKTLEKLTDLQAWYMDRKANDPDFISDPAIERSLLRISQRHIADMTAQEVADLTDVLLNIENELRTEHKLIDSEDRRDTYHMGEETIENIYNTRGSKGGPLDKFIITETLSPLRQVRRMTGYVDDDPLYKLTQGLADGQRAMLDYQRKAERPFEKFANDKVFNKMFSGKDADGITITGYIRGGEKQSVIITPAMRVSLYLHSLNDQNLRHIKEGGITVPDEKLYRKGNMAEAYARGVTIKLTPSVVRSITVGMTTKERAFAEQTRKYFNITSKDSINAVSEKLKGYSIAQVGEYFPINTDGSFTRSEFESLKRDGTIEGMGFLKERVNAANPILLRDANAVLEQAIRMHSKYVGLAIPVRNFNKVWNVTTGSFNEDGSRSAFDGSVQQAIKQHWGETGYSYIEKLMGDLQMGTSAQNEWAKALGKLRSNYARAVLTLNLSVAMKQAASYPTAAAVLGWKPLVRALADTGKVDLATVEKYTPLLWYRGKGFSTKELGDLKSADRQLPAILNWVQGMDLLTTRKLWKASEYYVRQHNKDLTPGTEAFYQATAEIYNRVIEETQPNYTTMQRPQLLRSDDTLMGNLMMFKTQPFQNSNILYDAVGNYVAKAQRATTGGEQEKADAKKAKKDLGNAITSQLAQLAVFAGLTMAWALIRGKDDKYRDEDGNMIITSVLPAIAKDMAGGSVSGIPFGTDAWELISSKIFGDKYYGMDAVTVTAISDTLKALSSLSEQTVRIAENVASGKDTNWNAERLKFDAAFDDISKAMGIPYENVINLFKATYLHSTKATQGEYLGTYAYLKLTTDPEKYPGDYYDNLYKAFTNNKADYQTLYAEMIQDGFTPEKIKTNMEKRMKDAQGVKKVEELQERYLAPSEKKAYDAAKSKISRSEIWRAADQEKRDDVLGLLYELASGSNTAAAKSAREKIADGAAYGLDETEYLLYKLALSMTGQPTESGKFGSYTNAEVQEAIDMIPGLTDQERSYLWEVQGKSEKNNPYR